MKMCLVRPLAAIGVWNYEIRKSARKSQAQMKTSSRHFALFVVKQKRSKTNASATDEQLVQLTYFGGLPLEQAAEVLGVSCRTVYRHWAFARVWLYNAITKEEA